MLKFFAIASLVVSAIGGVPIDDDVKGEGVARQYRVAAEEYFKVVYESKIHTYDAEKVKFFLYTSQEPKKYELKSGHLQQMLTNSSYDIGRPTKVLIHDRFFSENYYKELIAAYLRHFHKPVNVITVDYSYYSGAEHMDFMRVYREIGETFAHFVEALKQYGTTGDKIHVTGHGIGAHIVAVAARKLAPFKFDRITGLSPAGLEFDQDNSLPQLRKRDADFVDVILTNMGEIGSSQSGRGHVNFYPHGGISQPRGNMFSSHLKAYFYLVESVSRGKVFKAYAANSYSDFKSGQYNHTKVNYMGEYIKKNETGDFYLDVNPVPPYSPNVDSYNRPEKVKFNETYLTWILDTKLGSWVFHLNDDPYFRKAATNAKSVLVGLGEGHNMRTTTGHHDEEAPRYSTEPVSNNYFM